MPAPHRTGRPPMAEPWVWPRAAYVHIPFCAHKCGYCDFASLAGVDHLADRYLAALEREMAMIGPPQEVETIFIGGGTPTRLDARQLGRLLAMVGRPDLRRPLPDPGALGSRPRAGPGARARSPVVLRPGLREGDAP